MGSSPWGCEESDMTGRLPFHFSLSCIGEGNGNPFQCSCWENPRDSGAWWAAVYGVAQSRTRLKRLSSRNSRGFPGGSVVRNPLSNAGDSGDAGSIPGLGRSPGGGNDNPLQYSCLGKSHRQRSLAGYSPWGHKELDTTERLRTVSMVAPSSPMFISPPV